MILAFEKFQEEKNIKRVYGNFDDWLDLRCKVKKTWAPQLRLFYKLFHPYKKVLRCKLPFIWFVKNGKTIVDYFKSRIFEQYEDVIFGLETALNTTVANNAYQKKEGYRFVVDNSGEVTPFDWSCWLMEVTLQ